VCEGHGKQKEYTRVAVNILCEHDGRVPTRSAGG
jgi:hypothetical protein